MEAGKPVRKCLRIYERRIDSALFIHACHCDERKIGFGLCISGYDMNAYLKHLKYRLLNCACFPHEIGVFLGYPLEDVKGFIDNRGENCESCGVWKVYCNKEEKDKLFQKFKKCKEVYLQVFGEGRGLLQMTVCS